MNKRGKTDWNKVRSQTDDPVLYDPETDPYDPNEPAAVQAYWRDARISGPGRPRVAIKRPTLNMRVDADVLAYLRATGKGWQTRVNALLRDAVTQGRL